MGKSDDYPQGQAEPEVLFAALAGGAGFGENVGVGVVFEPGTTAHAGDRVAVGAAAYAHGRALGQLLGHKHLHVRLPSGPSRTPRIFAPRAKLRRAPWHLGFAPLQCRSAETPPETDVDASNPRPGAAAGSLSRGQSARSCRTRLIKVRQTSNTMTSVEQSGVYTTTGAPRNGGRDGRRRVQGTPRPHAPPGRASGGRP